jgi:hypothetical protein
MLFLLENQYIYQYKDNLMQLVLLCNFKTKYTNELSFKKKTFLVETEI